MTKIIEKNFKRILFSILTFRQYLTVVSRFYFLLFRLGILKNSTTYKYHYFIRNFIHKDDIIVDIGANLGYYSIPFSRWVGKKGFVYAVEPVTPVRDVLQKNIGKRKNIAILPYALGNENKNISMGNTRDKNGVIATGSHFVLETNAQASYEFSAEMKKGSEIFGELERLDFIKCDVEGYESVIIPEMKNILISHNPVMLIETRGEKRLFLLDFLNEIGYSGYILDGGKLYPVKGELEERDDDIIFIHKNKLEFYSDLISS